MISTLPKHINIYIHRGLEEAQAKKAAKEGKDGSGPGSRQKAKVVKGYEMTLEEIAYELDPVHQYEVNLSEEQKQSLRASVADIQAELLTKRDKEGNIIQDGREIAMEIKHEQHDSNSSQVGSSSSNPSNPHSNVNRTPQDQAQAQAGVFKVENQLHQFVESDSDRSDNMVLDDSRDDSLEDSRDSRDGNGNGNSNGNSNSNGVVDLVDSEEEEEEGLANNNASSNNNSSNNNINARASVPMAVANPNPNPNVPMAVVQPGAGADMNNVKDEEEAPNPNKRNRQGTALPETEDIPYDWYASAYVLYAYLPFCL